MKKLFLLVALILTFQATSVFAQSEPLPAVTETPEMAGQNNGQKKEKPLKGDTDGDGMISKEEYLKSAEDRFDVMDQTKDGKLSREEMRAAHIKRKAQMEKRKNQNKANQEYYDKKLDREKKKLERVGTTITR